LKMDEFPSFKGSWPWLWIGSHTAYSRASLIDLYGHTKFHFSSGRTDVPFETHFIRSTRRSRPNNNVLSDGVWPIMARHGAGLVKICKKKLLTQRLVNPYAKLC